MQQCQSTPPHGTVSPAPSTGLPYNSVFERGLLQWEWEGLCQPQIKRREGFSVGHFLQMLFMEAHDLWQVNKLTDSHENSDAILSWLPINYEKQNCRLARLQWHLFRAVHSALIAYSNLLYQKLDISLVTTENGMSLIKIIYTIVMITVYEISC